MVTVSKEVMVEVTSSSSSAELDGDGVGVTVTVTVTGAHWDASEPSEPWEAEAEATGSVTAEVWVDKEVRSSLVTVTTLVIVEVVVGPLEEESASEDSATAFCSAADDDGAMVEVKVLVAEVIVLLSEVKVTYSTMVEVKVASTEDLLEA